MLPACVCNVLVFTDCVQPAVATLQLSYPCQNIHGRVIAYRFCGASAHGCQLVREGGEFRSVAPVWSFMSSCLLMIQTYWQCVFVRSGVGHVWRVLCQPPRPETYPDRLWLRGSSLQEGFPSIRIRRGKFFPHCVCSVSVIFMRIFISYIHLHAADTLKVSLAGCQWDGRDESCAQTSCWFL